MQWVFLPVGGVVGGPPVGIDRGQLVIGKVFTSLFCDDGSVGHGCASLRRAFVCPSDNDIGDDMGPIRHPGYEIASRNFFLGSITSSKPSALISGASPIPFARPRLCTGECIAQ